MTQIDRYLIESKRKDITNNPSSARAHREEHTRVKHLIDPTQNLRFAKRLAKHPTPEKVDATSPLWMHEEVRRRAIQFRRDYFRYDFLQWDGGASQLASSKCHGYLLYVNNPEHQPGVIAGACAFFPKKRVGGSWAGSGQLPSFGDQEFLQADGAHSLSNTETLRLNILCPPRCTTLF